MNHTELKRLARHIAANFLRELAENDTALENGLEIFCKYLEDSEKQQLVEAIQEIIEKLSKP